MYKMSAALLFAAIFVSSAMAQGDPRFCRNYAHNAASLGDAVMKKNAKCLDLSRGLHPDYKSHFDWCMRQLPSSVQGAEANIRRLASQCNATGPAPSAPRPASGAGEEPFGQNIGSWQFTQAPDRTKVFCRAKSGSYVVGRYGNGQYRLSVNEKGLKGSFEGANLGIGTQNSPVTASSDGSRVYIPVDETEMAQIIRAGGFSWRAWNRQGTVRYDNALGPAVARLKECTRANGGR